VETPEGTNIEASDIVPSESELASLEPQIREIRHDLHRHPELGFEEHRTQKLVQSWLERYGYAPRACAKTGLVADLRPDLLGQGRTIALRADLDCLPMHETTDLPWRSVHAGRAHKCGHDGHTAILMGVAAWLAEHRAALRGNVRLLFQPAEEGVRGGGARVMVDEGALDQVDEIYALHNWPDFPLGEVRVCPGAIMAQTHSLEIEVEGVGGHGSQPQLCRDPIVAASHLVCALQTAVSRGLGWRGGAVLSICKFQAGTADNVIPDRARLAGTLRTFAPDVTERVLERMREVVEGTASTFGVQTNLEIDAGYPVFMNDDACAAAVRRVAERVVGGERVSDEGLPIAGGEDFAYFTRAIPGAYFLMGSGDPVGATHGCHHPHFDFDDRLIPNGIRMLAGLASDRLSRDRRADPSGR
jgi:amidohydrolase